MKHAALWILLAFGSVIAVPPVPAAMREYFIAAEDVVWDFAPSGQDLVHGGRIPRPYRTKWKKTRYIEYTDATFTTPKPQPPWLGILGPIIRAEVGDEILVHFQNRSRRAHGIHPHGVRYDKANEGAHYIPAGAGAAIPPGGAFDYHWTADERSAPGPDDPSSIVRWYHGHVDEPFDTNVGLLGPIVGLRASPAATPRLTRRGPARARRKLLDLPVLHGRRVAVHP